VICENVVGFAERRNSLAFQALQRSLRRVGYDVATRILDAADYGVPQYRKRVFLLAVRGGQADRVFESLRPKGRTPPVRTAFRGLGSTRQDKGQSHVFMNHGAPVRAKLRILKPGGPISYRRLVWRQPAPTLVAGHRALPVHPSQPRAISVREAARLQGFDDSYLFEGSNSSQIIQVANAVPPPLAMAIAGAILRADAHNSRVRGPLYQTLAKRRSPALRRRLTHVFRQTFASGARRFPWRRLRSPFRILLTEMLLQRTNAELAETVWRDVLTLVPSARAAAGVDLRSLAALTRRIGIRSRARTIKELGTVLLRRHHGRIPDAFDDLLRLPGVGLYIASAVRCFSFGQRDFPVDSNVFRFVSRYFGVEVRGKKSEARQIREFMSELMPRQNVSEYVYGFLDFAATFCRPLKPQCGTCPLRPTCRRYGLAAE
jgi:A/G-specific adenine glycosylase